MADQTPQPAQPEPKLSAKQRAFLEHYLTCWNATKAAIAAGYSEKTAQEQGSRLLSNVMVSRAKEERLAQLAMGADEVLVRLAQMARGTIADFITVTPDGNWTINLAEAEKKGLLHLIKTLEDSPKFGKKIELHDPQAALVHIGKHLGLFKDAADQIMKFLDLSKLTPSQVQRVAQGDDIFEILLNPNG